MNGWEPAGPRLALLADAERETARAARPMLLARGLELVHARAGIAALELIQRMSERFILAIIGLNLADLPGMVVIETLRLFRPELPVVCLADVGGSAPGYDAASCLSKPIRHLEFNLQLEGALTRSSAPLMLATVDPEAVERAKRRYAESGNLLHAAREIALGLAGYSEQEE